MDKFSNADLIRLKEFGYLFEALDYSSRRRGVACFVKLLSCCPQLATLTYHGSTDPGEEPLDAAGDTLVMSTAVANCCGLEKLWLSCVDISTTPIGNFQNLRDLGIQECEDIPVSAFETISAMTKLEVLFLDCCPLLGVDASVELLARGCPNLKDIEISQLGDDATKKISPKSFVILLKSHSQHLERVHFDFDYGMLFSPSGHRREGVAMEIAEALSLCPHLHEISIQLINSGLFILNDQCLNVLSGRCTQLKTIMLEGSEATGSTLEWNRRELTIDGVRALALACPLLTEIQLKFPPHSSITESTSTFFPASQLQLLKAQFPRLVIR